jgi:hypothetical protein
MKEEATMMTKVRDLRPGDLIVHEGVGLSAAGRWSGATV